jgi:hypothetical protein
MTGFLMRSAVVLGGFVGLMAWTQASAQAPAPTARVCTSRGQPANAGVAPPWAITVSNEGLWCSHVRIPATRTNNTTFEVQKAPQHGEVSQAPNGPQTVISYKPVKGYVGPDSFTLHLARGNIEYQYLVNVIP